MVEDILKEAALVFQALLYVEYHIVLGRKMQTRELHLCFLPDNFYHLAGLHKLRDSYPFRFLSHKKVFRHILSGKVHFEMIRSDAAVPQLIPRMKALTEIERVLDDGETTFFQYERRKTAITSRIAADYLAKGSLNGAGVVFTFFLKEKDCFYVDSIFPMSSYDYSWRQARYTVLLKEKRNRQNGETTVLFKHRNYASASELMTERRVSSQRGSFEGHWPA